MAISEIKKKRPKSHRALLAVLRNAISDSVDNQYKAVAVVLLGKDADYSDFFIVPGTEIGAVTLLLEELKTEITESRYED